MSVTTSCIIKYSMEGGGVEWKIQVAKYCICLEALLTLLFFIMQHAYEYVYDVITDYWFYMEGLIALYEQLLQL